MKTDREIEKLIEGHFPDTADAEHEPGWIGWSEMSYSWNDDANKTQLVDGLGWVTLLDAYTGEEGGQEGTYMIFQVQFDNGEEQGTTKLYRMAGYYASYSGTEWDGDLHEVKAREKTITVYDTVKAA